MRIQFTEGTSLGDGGQFDFVFSCLELRQVYPSAQRATDSRSQIAAAITQLRTRVDDFLQSEYIEIAAGVGGSTSTLLDLEKLIRSSLLAEKSNIHKSTYLDLLFLAAWIGVEVNSLQLDHSEKLEVFVPTQQLADEVRGFVPDLSTRIIVSGLEEGANGEGIARPGLARYFAFIFLKSLAWLVLDFVSKFRSSPKTFDVKFQSGGILWLDYFFGRLEEGPDEGRSKFWKDLESQLDSAANPASFAHIFVPDEEHRSLTDARNSKLFSHRPSLLVQDLQRPIDYWKTLKSISKLYFLNSRRFLLYRFLRKKPLSRIDYEMTRDLALSLFGTVACTNLLYSASFSRLAEKCNKENIKAVAYLCEFQGWETLLLEQMDEVAIKAIGYCHSTVRTLDLRGLEPGGEPYGPLRPRKPAIVGSHSLADIRKLKEKDPSLRVCKVESTRYSQIPPVPEETRSSRTPKKICIVGGYSNDETEYLLRICDELFEAEPREFEFYFLPHPASKLKSASFPLLDRPKNSSLADILSGFSAAVVAPESSASMEALLLGLPVTLVVRPLKLVASPIFESKAVTLVSTAKALAASLSSNSPASKAERQLFMPFVPMDSEYPMWEKAVARLV